MPDDTGSSEVEAIGSVIQAQSLQYSKLDANTGYTTGPSLKEKA